MEGTMEAVTSLEDVVVQQCHKIFEGLPMRCKPRELRHPKTEWIPLSAIAIARSDGDVKVLSLGTGMKCMPANDIPGSSGIVLHDWHAEIVAIRAFNRFLVEECHQLAANGRRESDIVEWRKPQATGNQCFSIRDDIKICMYCSEVPCGDASMELVMEAQEDCTPWPSCTGVEGGQSLLLGRGSFDKLGLVRRKPSRADSPATLSKSCSDKIALKQCTSLLSGPMSLLISPSNAYIHTLIIPEKQYRAEACERAFGQSGRLHPLNDHDWPGGYSFRPFDVKTTKVQFSYSRDARNCLGQGNSIPPPGVVLKGSNISAVWVAHTSLSEPTNVLPSNEGNLSLGAFWEVLVNGRLQGWKAGDGRGASKLSRKKLWEAVDQVLSLLPAAFPDEASYMGLKRSGMLEERRSVKADATREALKGWIPNITDDFKLKSRLSES